jgi:hypothetical protein
VARDIEMQEPSRTDFHDEEDVNEMECRRYHNKEIARDNGLRMIAYKSHPALARVCWPVRQLRYVTTNGSRRNPDADF